MPQLGHTESSLVDVGAVYMDIGQRQKEKNDTHSCMYVPPAMNLRLQASTPSSHLCSIYLLPAPPHFLYHAPPGAQQLTLPDFSNVPHCGHAIVLAVIEVMVGVLATMSSRSDIGRRDMY